MASTVAQYRHEARDAVAPVAGLLRGVPGLTNKQQKERLKAAEKGLETALEAVRNANEARKANKG